MLFVSAEKFKRAPCLKKEFEEYFSGFDELCFRFAVVKLEIVTLKNHFYAHHLTIAKGVNDGA